MLRSFWLQFHVRIFPAGISVVTRSSPPSSEDGCPLLPPLKPKVSVEKCTFYDKKVETNSISFFFFFFTNIKFLVNMYSLWASSRAGSISQMRHTIYTFRAKKPLSHGDPKWNAKTETPIFSDLSKYLWTKRQKKLQQTFSQICPGEGRGCSVTQRPSNAWNTQHDTGEGAWAFPTRKHLG